jgi:hypothetical protein
MKFGSYNFELVVGGRLFSGGSFLQGVHFVLASQLLTTHSHKASATTTFGIPARQASVAGVAVSVAAIAPVKRLQQANISFIPEQLRNCSVDFTSNSINSRRQVTLISTLSVAC